MCTAQSTGLGVQFKLQTKRGGAELEVWSLLKEKELFPRSLRPRTGRRRFLSRADRLRRQAPLQDARALSRFQVWYVDLRDRSLLQFDRVFSSLLGIKQAEKFAEIRIVSDNDDALLPWRNGAADPGTDRNVASGRNASSQRDVDP